MICFITGGRRKQSSSEWSGKWESLSAPSVNDPVVVQNADGRLEIFVIRIEDRELHHRWQTTKNDSTKWSDWVSLQAQSILPCRRPAVAKNADGRLEVFIPGRSQGQNQIYHRWQTTKNDSTKWSDKWEILPDSTQVLGKTDKWEILPDSTSWPFNSNPVVIGAIISSNPVVFMEGLEKKIYLSTKNTDTEEWSSWMQVAAKSLFPPFS